MVPTYPPMTVTFYSPVSFCKCWGFQEVLFAYFARKNFGFLMCSVKERRTFLVYPQPQGLLLHSSVFLSLWASWCGDSGCREEVGRGHRQCRGEAVLQPPSHFPSLEVMLSGAGETRRAEVSWGNG